jgi:hypothetical protein
MNPTALGGKASIAINEIEIPSYMISEITPNFVEGTRTRTTLGGVFNRPSGVFETAELSFTLFLPSYDYLKNIFPGEYNAPTAPQTTGNLIFGAGTCSTTVAVPVNIHYECEGTDANDIHIFGALAAMNFNPTLNDSDDLSVQVTLYAQPTTAGLFRLGTGDLTAPSIYDPATETTIPVAS